MIYTYLLFNSIVLILQTQNIGANRYSAGHYYFIDKGCQGEPISLLIKLHCINLYPITLVTGYDNYHVTLTNLTQENLKRKHAQVTLQENVLTCS